MAVERMREMWALIERGRRSGETWADAAERQMYAAMIAEGHQQKRIAEFMGTHPVQVCRRIKRYGLRGGKAQAETD